MKKIIYSILASLLFSFSLNVYSENITHHKNVMVSINKLHCTVTPCPDTKDY